MKKLSITILTTLILSLSMIGCGSAYGNSHKIEEETIKTIASCIDTDDAETLVGMFSENIRSSNNSLTDEAQDFLDFFAGEDIQYKYDGGYTKELSNESEIVAFYYITTTEDRYFVEFVIAPTSDDSTSIGIQSLGVQQADDEEANSCMAPDYRGIYVVTVDNHEEIQKLEERGL